jgi:hypothetical protein
MGTIEVAELLGVSRQRIYALRNTALWRKHVPHVYPLQMGSIFLAEEVRAFQAAWDRKPGRPRKETGAPGPE